MRYCLGNCGATNAANWTSVPIIFPFLAKGSIYRATTIFVRHLAAFQYELQTAGEIVLVGKNFQNADHELNGMIRWTTYGSANRVLHIVDPNPDANFEVFHCSLFNARLGSRYAFFAKDCDRAEQCIGPQGSIRSSRSSAGSPQRE